MVDKMKKILANATVSKLKEYRMSYGGVEEVHYPFIIEYNDKIELIGKSGNVQRTMRKYTKVLQSWQGTEITERAFNMRVKKAKKAYNESVVISKQESERIKSENDAIKNGLEDVLEDAIMAKIAKIKSFLSIEMLSDWKTFNHEVNRACQICGTEFISSLGWSTVAKKIKEMYILSIVAY